MQARVFLFSTVYTHLVFLVQAPLVDCAAGQLRACGARRRLSLCICAGCWDHGLVIRSARGLRRTMPTKGKAPSILTRPALGLSARRRQPVAYPILLLAEDASTSMAASSQRAPAAMVVKRCIDVVGALAGLVFLAVPMTLIAVAIRVTMGPGVIFKQARPGLKGEPFEIYKFRTMIQERSASGQPLPDAARLSRLGRVLRKTSLDELPELFNVLKGEMSLVGPRPLLMDYLDLYTAEQARRHEVRPGMTGWAQINGRNAISWEEKFEHDVWYVDNWSIGVDLKILLSTFVTVARFAGVNQPGHATVENFRGSAEVGSPGGLTEGAR